MNETLTTDLALAPDQIQVLRDRWNEQAKELHAGSAPIVNASLTVQPLTQSSVSLVMIVKDEAAVIERALNSVRTLIDYAFICDTGSSDGTQQIIKDWLQANGVPGEVIEEPWKNFGYNRSHVLAKLRELRPDIDFAFMLDADEAVTFNGDPKEFKRRLVADLYNVDMRLGTTAYALPRITSNRLPFYYRGPAHEWPDCKMPFTRGYLPGITITELSGGAREKDPNTYRNDAKLFEDELRRTDLDALEHSRYTFYLAQSLRDAGQWQRSLEAYWKRVDLGGWFEEVYISLLNAARLQEQLKHPLTDIIKTYGRATAVNPRRIEAVHGATRALRLANMHHEAYAVAQPHVRVTSYTGLFVETWIYDYGLLDEFSISAYYAGQHNVAWLAGQALLGKDLDAPTRQRIVTNARFAQLAKPL